MTGKAKRNKYIYVKCSTCGYRPPVDKKMSNKNWKVYDTKCPKCGGEIELDFKECTK